MLRSPRKTIKRVARVWVVTDRRKITGVSERAGADLEWHALEYQIEPSISCREPIPGVWFGYRRDLPSRGRRGKSGEAGRRTWTKRLK